MCLMVYIGSNQPLDLVPWDASAPGFHVRELGEQDGEVRSQFHFPNVCYVGSHEGCGCGFQLGEYPEFKDDGAPAKRDTLRRFASYLTSQIKRGRKLEIFACWDGDQGVPPERRRTLSPSDLVGERFFFLEKEHVTVVDAA
jgi:hypothetical protein